MTAPYAARDDDTEGLAQIAELLEKVADEKAPLPDIEATRRRPSHGLHLTSRLTVGEWLDMWLQEGTAERHQPRREQHPRPPQTADRSPAPRPPPGHPRLLYSSRAR